MKRVIAVFGFVAFFFASAAVSFGADAVSSASNTQKAQVAAPQTLQNLADAYSGESSAREKYLSYAVKADEEGYKKVAQLFRGAAKSEEIHAAMYAKAITELGSVPKADIKKAAVKSTKENLQDAINGETYESGTMYPKFLEQAKTDNIKMAMMGFGSAMKVEKNHLALFADALKNLDGWKIASKKGFYVCTICGNLVEKLNFAVCPICKAPIDKFEQVK